MISYYIWENRRDVTAVGVWRSCWNYCRAVCLIYIYWRWIFISVSLWIRKSYNNSTSHRAVVPKHILSCPPTTCLQLYVYVCLCVCIYLLLCESALVCLCLRFSARLLDKFTVFFLLILINDIRLSVDTLGLNTARCKTPIFGIMDWKKATTWLVAN